MNDRRPINVILALVACAAVSLVGSVVLDNRGKWGGPRQAVANALWILFLVSVFARGGHAVGAAGGRPQSLATGLRRSSAGHGQRAAGSGR